MRIWVSYISTVHIHCMSMFSFGRYPFNISQYIVFFFKALNINICICLQNYQSGLTSYCRHALSSSGGKLIELNTGICSVSLHLKTSLNTPPELLWNVLNKIFVRLPKAKSSAISKQEHAVKLQNVLKQHSPSNQANRVNVCLKCLKMSKANRGKTQKDVQL